MMKLDRKKNVMRKMRKWMLASVVCSFMLTVLCQTSISAYEQTTITSEITHYEVEYVVEKSHTVHQSDSKGNYKKDPYISEIDATETRRRLIVNNKRLENDGLEKTLAKALRVPLDTDYEVKKELKHGVGNEYSMYIYREKLLSRYVDIVREIESEKKDVQWVDEMIHIQGKDGNGIYDGMFPKDFAVDPFAYVSQDAVQKDGYTLSGWEDITNNRTYQVGEAVYADANNPLGRTLAPIYVPNAYKIHFDGNGNTGGTMEDVDMVYDQEKTLPMNAFTKTGYTFAGWELKNDVYADGQDVKNLTTAMNDVVDLKAKWDINKYDVTFTDEEGTVLKKETVEYDHAAKAPENMTEKGYTFAGWDKDFTHVVSDMNIVGSWTANHYSVKYDVDADMSIADKTLVTWEDKNLLPESNPVKEGYQFAGWEYDGKKVTADDTYGMLTTDDTDGSMIVLHAVWKKEDKKEETAPFVPNANIQNGGNGTSGSTFNKDMSDGISRVLPGGKQVQNIKAVETMGMSKAKVNTVASHHESGLAIVNVMAVVAGLIVLFYSLINKHKVLSVLLAACNMGMVIAFVLRTNWHFTYFQLVDDMTKIYMVGALSMVILYIVARKETHLTQEISLDV